MKQTELKRKTPLKRTELRRYQSNQPKRRAISPASKPQRLAVSGGRCVGCGREGSEWLAIDPAHLWPRGKGGCDSRFCVIPLCRDFQGNGCHRRLDENDGTFDLLSVLVADWDKWRHHFQHALQHTTPVQLVERLAGSRVLWAA